MVGGENHTRLYWAVIDVSVLNVVVLLHLHRLIMIVVVHVMLLVVDDDGGMLCTTPLNGERVLSSTITNGLLSTKACPPCCTRCPSSLLKHLRRTRQTTSEILPWLPTFVAVRPCVFSKCMYRS